MLEKMRKRRFRPLTNELVEGIGRKRDWKRDFGEKKGFWIKRN